MSIWTESGDFENVVLSRPRDHVAMLTLNRPRQLNAYTHALCKEVVAAIEDYLRDDGLRCLVVTGAGRAFCSGGDVSGVDGHRETLRDKQLSTARDARRHAPRDPRPGQGSTSPSSPWSTRAGGCGWLSAHSFL